MDDVSLLIGSSKLTGWEEISVNKSMDTIAGSFNFKMVDVWEGDPIDLVPNLSCSVSIDNTKVLTGYIDDVSIKAAQDDKYLTITGRDKTGDLVDCSADHKPGSWSKIGVQKLIYELVRPFGLRVYAEADLGENIKEFTINTGESPFDAIQRICQDRGILPLSNVDGDLVLTTSGINRSTDNLVYGENVVDAEVSYDFTNRFSLYKVKGQKTNDGDSWTTTTTEITGEAKDEGIPRYRPKVITADGQMTNSLAARRAAWEAQVRAGRSGKLLLTLPTWKQSSGALWTVNTIVSCDIPVFRVTPDQNLLIHEIEYKQSSEGGTTSVLHLIRDDSYAAEPKAVVKKKKRSQGYGFGW